MTQQKPESKAGQGGIKELAISPTCQHTPFPPSWPSKIITVVQQAPSWDWDFCPPIPHGPIPRAHLTSFSLQEAQGGGQQEPLPSKDSRLTTEYLVTVGNTDACL